MASRIRGTHNFVKKKTMIEKARDTLLGPSVQEERIPTDQRRGDTDAMKDIS